MHEVDEYVENIIRKMRRQKDQDNIKMNLKERVDWVNVSQDRLREDRTEPPSSM
jgi:hypothetical protein